MRDRMATTPVPTEGVYDAQHRALHRTGGRDRSYALGTIEIQTMHKGTRSVIPLPRIPAAEAERIPLPHFLKKKNHQITGQQTK